MEDIINTLYPMNRGLLGAGYDNALEYLKMLLPFEIIEIPSGTRFGTWTVPEEWVIKDAWVKYNGEKILDYSTEPLSVIHGALPIKGKVTLLDLKSHIVSDYLKPDATVFGFKYYDKDWGFSMPYSQLMGLAEGDYEVLIDSEYRPGTMKIAVHTIPGKSEREILLFAHLDHPYQANDNLSGVACLVDLATKIKCDHTVKIILCPETIGSIAYGHTQDLSNVDFVIAVDICGNDNPLMLQKSFNREDKINRVANLAIHIDGDFRASDFRSQIGSDEYYFNDPKVGIPGILLTTWPYDEYHTTDDTPEIIDYDQIKRTQKSILKIIDIYERDFIPERTYTGPLMLSKYGAHTNDKRQNLLKDYFFYFMDGKRSVVELCSQYGMDFDTMVDLLTKLENDGFISRIDSGKGKVKPSAGKKQTRLPRKANVGGKRKKVS